VNGLEVLARIRANALTRQLPVVVVTSSQEEPDIRKAYELGVNSYIVKAVEFEKFVAAVGEVGLYWLVLNQPPA
jgi:CheY-like chemotaxis protein